MDCAQVPEEFDRRRTDATGVAIMELSQGEVNTAVGLEREDALDLLDGIALRLQLHR